MFLCSQAKRKHKTPRFKPEVFFLKFIEVLLLWYLSLFPISGQKDKWYIINVLSLLKWLFIKGWLAGGPFPQHLVVVMVVLYILILVITKWPPEFGWTFHYFCVIREHFFPQSMWQGFSCKPGQLQYGHSLLFFWFLREGIPSVHLPCWGCVFNRILSLELVAICLRLHSLTRTTQMQFGVSSGSMPFPLLSCPCFHELLWPHCLFYTLLIIINIFILCNTQCKYSLGFWISLSELINASIWLVDEKFIWVISKLQQEKRRFIHVKTFTLCLDWLSCSPKSSVSLSVLGVKSSGFPLLRMFWTLFWGGYCSGFWFKLVLCPALLRVWASPWIA